MTTKVNPAATTTNEEMIGKDLQFFTVDYTTAINGSAGPLGAQKSVLDTIMATSTIVAVGPLTDTNTQQTFAVEGTDTVVVGTLQTAIRALGTVDSIDLSNSTVTETKLGILTAAAVS